MVGGNCDAMSDVDGDNVWDVTISLTPGDNVEYKYSADSWTIQEMNDPGVHVQMETLLIQIEY